MYCCYICDNSAILSCWIDPVWARECCWISPPRFLAECCKRQLNQGSFVLLYFRLFTFFYLYSVCVSVFSCTVLFVSISQVIGCEDRLRNDLYCVEWGVKLYSNQPTVLNSLFTAMHLFRWHIVLCFNELKFYTSVSMIFCSMKMYLTFVMKHECSAGVAKYILALTAKIRVLSCVRMTFVLYINFANIWGQIY